MSIQELYNWGKENNILDYDIAINYSCYDFYIGGIFDFNNNNTEIDRENKLAVLTEIGNELTIDYGL